MQTVINGNSLDILPTLEADSVDSVVCDPPYELGFMGKSWDSTGIAYNVQLWREVLRVLKPGGHLLAFGGSRTFHRLACAIEDAGFEIRDQLLWIYGSGFPKSLDISKAIDKQAGAERETGKLRSGAGNPKGYKSDREMQSGGAYKREFYETTPATPAAIQWQGWGTALKPAHEPICMARKPFKGTVADNVLQHGTGGLNVDAGRIGTEEIKTCAKEKGASFSSVGDMRGFNGVAESFHLGRFPSNLMLSETAAQDLDESVGELTSGSRVGGDAYKLGAFEGQKGARGLKVGGACEGSSGGPSRYFYVAKSSKREREAGLSGFEVVSGVMGNGGKDTHSEFSQDIGLNRNISRQNHHPTVKPIKLMEYLVKLVTPPNGIVLDPFTGSGSTGCACARSGFGFIGIEKESKYKDIAEARIKHFACELA